MMSAFNCESKIFNMILPLLNGKTNSIVGFKIIHTTMRRHVCFIAYTTMRMRKIFASTEMIFLPNANAYHIITSN